MSHTLETPAKPSTPARRSWIRVAITPLFMVAVLFAAAGRLDWYGAWTYIALLVVMQVRVIVMLRRTSPDLLVERSRIREGTKSWDRVIAPLIALVLPILMWLTAGLDLRYAWTVAFPPPVQVLGFIVAAASAELAAWAMAANRFFASTVRIQTDRGHHAVSSGPYSVVRHPGYVGMLVFTLATPLALGSLVCFIPAGLCALLMLLRTVLEDRTLRAELAGYPEYAQRVRWRLIPGLW